METRGRKRNPDLEVFTKLSTGKYQCTQCAADPIAEASRARHFRLCSGRRRRGAATQAAQQHQLQQAQHGQEELLEVDPRPQPQEEQMEVDPQPQPQEQQQAPQQQERRHAAVVRYIRRLHVIQWEQRRARVEPQKQQTLDQQLQQQELEQLQQQQQELGQLQQQQQDLDGGWDAVPADLGTGAEVEVDADLAAEPGDEVEADDSCGYSSGSDVGFAVDVPEEDEEEQQPQHADGQLGDAAATAAEAGVEDQAVEAGGEMEVADGEKDQDAQGEEEEEEGEEEVEVEAEARDGDGAPKRTSRWYQERLDQPLYAGAAATLREAIYFWLTWRLRHQTGKMAFGELLRFVALVLLPPGNLLPSSEYMIAQVCHFPRAHAQHSGFRPPAPD